MTRLRWLGLALGLLGMVAALAAARSGLARGTGDSPEARLKARIADLHAEVALLDVECQAAGENLRESLKKLGQLELGDRDEARRKIQEELGKLDMMVGMIGVGDRGEALKQLQADVQRRGDKEEKEQFKLFADLVKGGDAGHKAEGALVELEFKLRLRAARGEADRMKADFQKKARLLHQKRLELAEAEAEYKSSR
jgi:hypothetical protein